jgi:hypothetical protein
LSLLKTKKEADMTPEAIRGRKITIIIALVVAIPAVLRLVLLWLLGLPHDTFTVGSIAFPILLSWLLYKGYGWVRGYLLVSFAFTSLLFVFAGVVQLANRTALESEIAGAISIAIGLSYLLSLCVLFRSKAVVSYFDHRSEAREGIISVLK